MNVGLYYYRVYDYIIETNYCCEYMIKAIECDFAKLKIIKVVISTYEISSSAIEKNRFRYRMYNNLFQGQWNDIAFEADLRNFIISVRAADRDEAFLFTLNVPLAVLISHDEKIVLHCSCVCDNKTVYGFSGSKGIGKSTLCSFFAYRNGQIFSDDTICIDIKAMRIYSNYMVEKYTLETVQALNNLYRDYMDLLSLYHGKRIKKLEYAGGYRDLSVLHINYLFRGSEFAKVEVDNKNAKAELLKNNIVGYKYADKNLQILVENNIKKVFDYCDLSTSILYIPFCNLFDAQELLCNLESLIFADKLTRS